MHITINKFYFQISLIIDRSELLVTSQQRENAKFLSGVEHLELTGTVTATIVIFREILPHATVTLTNPLVAITIAVNAEKTTALVKLVNIKTNSNVVIVMVKIQTEKSAFRD